MKIAFNPSTVAALTTPPNNKDITFDLRGRNIFARGVKFYGTDTNTWRDIKINNVSIGSYTLDLRNGSNTTLTNTNGVVTINSTWRPVVDNLTSDSTTSSLSAKQGKVLKALIDGKSNSDHNHDGRYLRLSGQDTMQGNLYLHSHGISYIGKGSGDKSGADFTEANIVIRSQWGISFKSYDDIVRTYIDTRTGNIGTKGVLNAAGAVIQGRVYNSGDDEGIIINLSSSGYAGLILGTHNGERSVFYFRQGHPFWRYNTGYTNLDIYHPKKSGTIALTSDIPDKNSWNYDGRYLRLSGQDTMQGNLYLHSHGISYIGKGSGDKSGADFTEANIVIRSQWGISFKSYDDIVRTYIDTRTGNIGTKGVLNAAGAVIQGRVYNSGDDEGIIINLSSSGYAGLILGTHNGERSVFYFRQGHPFWRYNTGYTNLDIYHPKKSGTIALTSDIPDKNSWNYDDRYLRLTGGWMLGDINFGDDNKILWMHNTDSAYISFKNDGDQDANSYMNFVTSGNGNEYFRWSYSSDSTNTEWMALKSDGLRVRGTKVSLEGHSHNDLYYTESEVNSLLDAKLNRQNLSYGNWNPRNHHLAAVYCCNGGNLSISELGDQIHVSIDGYFWQDEGQYRVLDTSDVLSLKNDLTVHQYLSNTDVAWYPLVWGGNSHRNTSDSTGAVYKSYDILSWQNSSQTLRATNIQTNNIKNLSIGGGIYWNPNVESASDGTDAASITVVKSGITGGTTLVLSQMNDTEDTIQFKTDAAARLYHNSYPILTTQNTYVRNSKGYINGVEITQVNNAATLDGIYYTKFLRQEVYPNNTENDFNTFSNMTLSGRADPTTGASLKNAPWSGSGPIGGYGVLTYLFRGEGYGTQMAWGYGENRIYIRNKFWGGDGVGIVWRTSWDALALTSDIPDKNSWNYDDRYLRLTGGWMLGDINFGDDNKILWMHNTDSAYISFKNDGDQDANSYMNFVTSGNGNEYFRWSYSSDSTNTEWMALKSDGLRVRGTKVSLEGHSHNDLYYTESEVNSLLDAKLNRQNLSYGNWNPRNHHLAAVYCCNGGNLSISELGDQIHVSIDGYFWQDEGQYRVLDTSDVLSLKNDLTVHQYLSNTDVAWYPLVWGGNSHRNTSDSTGAVYKSYDILSWQNSSQTLRATNIQTNNIKNLSIGGGIYWNPNVESASDGTDAASITVVKSGITGGTTLVLSQMNDTEDTIQFKTDAAARLYHNSYPILTTQNTYVRNSKGYINGVEITQVNNAATLDGIYYTKFLRQEVYPNNTENDFNTFSNMTLSGRADPTTGASLKNAPWSGSGPIGGYGVLTYLFRGEGYGTQMAWGYGENRIYIRNKFWGGDGVGIVWRTSWDALALTSDIPTVTNYYWADVKISASPSTNTSPTVSNLTATNSIRMSNIMLEHTDEINNRVNGGIYLNYRNSGNVSLCYGGGNVGIGITTSSYKLDVNGQMRASGFHHASVNSDNYMLLAGGGYSLLKTLIFTGKEFTYTDSSHYNLRFHKLSSLCNNLVWVDGHVSGPVNTLFTIADEVRPYCYNNDYSLVTIYNNCIRVDAQGRVALAVGSTTLRIGFFYTGKA